MRIFANIFGASTLLCANACRCCTGIWSVENGQRHSKNFRALLRHCSNDCRCHTGGWIVEKSRSYGKYSKHCSLVVPMLVGWCAVIWASKLSESEPGFFRFSSDSFHNLSRYAQSSESSKSTRSHVEIFSLLFFLPKLVCVVQTTGSSKSGRRHSKKFVDSPLLCASACRWRTGVWSFENG